MWTKYLTAKKKENKCALERKILHSSSRIRKPPNLLSENGKPQTHQNTLLWSKLGTRIGKPQAPPRSWNNSGTQKQGQPIVASSLLSSLLPSSPRHSPQFGNRGGASEEKGEIWGGPVAYLARRSRCLARARRCGWLGLGERRVLWRRRRLTEEAS
jgi:hypothetical protein